jgi:hypothetical protein
MGLAALMQVGPLEDEQIMCIYCAFAVEDWGRYVGLLVGAGL